MIRVKSRSPSIQLSIVDPLVGSSVVDGADLINNKLRLSLLLVQRSDRLSVLDLLENEVHCLELILPSTAFKSDFLGSSLEDVSLVQLLTRSSTP